MEKTYVKLFDFKIYNDNPFAESSDSDNVSYKDRDDKETIIQMFGMNEKGNTYSLYVTDFQPFFYIKVSDSWDKKSVAKFMQRLKKKVNKYYEDSIVKGKLVNKKTLYGFDNNKNYQFIQLVFKNTSVYNKVKGLWYTQEKDFRKRKLKPGGWNNTELYEAKLPPLLRYFHIKDISPSGWISFKKNDIMDNEGDVETCCDFEHWIDYKDINPERNMEDAIPLKICSFDIEASSSHGDFPLAKKTYLKLCREIVNYWNKNKSEIKAMEKDEKEQLFKELVYTAFGYSNKEEISEIFTKKQSSKNKISKFLTNILNDNIKKFKQWPKKETYSQNNFNDKDMRSKKIVIFKNKDLNNKSIIALLDSNEDVLFKGEILNRIFTGIYNYSKITLLNNTEVHGEGRDGVIANMDNLALDLNERYDKGENRGKTKYTFIESNLNNYNSSNIKPKKCLPEVEGDKVTFIGSTFMIMGEKEQYKNNMIVLNSCSKCPDVPHCEIETYETENDVLLAWTNMIQREDPDVIIGYNIFGFDYKFMIERTEELSCKKKFLKLSRNVNECSQVVNSSIKIASGTHDLQYIQMTGRLQLDLYNYFRREVNLPSYKLDNVASHFIGDMIGNIEYGEDEKTIIHSKNLIGLKNGHYICFEILGHSNDMFRHGKKFIVEELNETAGTFKIATDITELKGKKFRWCLAKDDVTPQDIFRLTNEGPDERAIIAKYCFQDCNLVHNLMMKNDILTGMSEIANICYVPISYIIMRGQGIKLLSFIAKKCSEKNTLMPVLDVEKGDSSYEGAICLHPHCGLYINNPVAVVDYASLYPSSMISENISHDSKVWTKEYDLDGNIVKDPSGNEAIYGKRDKKGNFIYDNLPEYEYVDITYDRYVWRRKGTGKAQEKIKVGTKTCRFAQFPDGKKAIMPSVLHELLAGRKATRKFIKYKTVTTNAGESFSGLVKKTDTKYIITGEKETKEYLISEVEKVEDTYDDFMKNVFDKRQLGLKVTANSLYGQTGAKTSSFYEMDIAASTTATGRKLLIYAKKIIEGIYGNKICDTKYGKIRCKSKVVYGDTDSCFMTFGPEELDGTKIIGKKALDITIELAIECGELASKFLKPPHDLEYEKTFDPFLLLSKKRYVGMLYETNINKCKRKSMGIVLKRRDNAPVVKDIYGGIIDIIMKEQNVEKAVLFTKQFLQDIIDEKIGMEKLIITKSLREFYKCPDSIAHKVLADRMGKRDPGNKPSTGSRIPYIYIQTKGNVKLQGDKIEHPDFIKEHKLKPDYKIYITNQIMKPVTQIYALVLEQLGVFQKRRKAFERKVRSLKRKWKDNEKKCHEYIMKERNKHVKELIFNDTLRIYNNKRNGQPTIQSMFGF
jgi:DNA polymerase elongation subunit (family B)